MPRELYIEFAKWFDGQYGFICSDWVFNKKSDLVNYYGIKKIKIVDRVFIPEIRKFIPIYSGIATKNLNETHGIKWN